MPHASTPFVALARFHAASGARVAMRAAVPLAGAITVAIGLTPNPYGTLRATVAEAATPQASNGFVAAALALAFGLAGWAAPRVASGAGGWMISLPCDAATRRRALVLGIAAAQAPLAIAIVLFSIFGGLRWERIAALVPVTLGAAYTVLPRRRFLSAPLGAAGAIAAFSSFLLGCALVVAADLVAGGEKRERARHRREVGVTASARRLALRATATRVPEAWMLAALPAVAGFLFTTNNDLAPELLARGSRLGVGMAVVVALAVMADRLATRRPVWRWARSLPWTSRRRVVEDAMYLGAIALPVVAVSAIAAPLPALFALIALPGAAVRAAGSMRRAGTGRLGGISSFFLEGMLGAVAFALSPWAVLAAIAATPWWLNTAARDEARLPVSRFAPVLHHAPGDPASWTGR